MKKNNKYKLFKYIFYILLLCFMVIYFSEQTGYYEYQNYKKKELTKEQIIQFEQDVKEGKNIDIQSYLETDNYKYNSKFSKLTSKLSDTISSLVEKGVENTFKYMAKFIE